MAEQYDEFDDFKPAKVDDGVNDTVKKVIEKELSKLVDFVLLKSSFKDTDNNRVWIETAIDNMQMMGLLIETEAGLLKITDLGLSAYNSQLQQVSMKPKNHDDLLNMQYTSLWLE